MKVTTKLLPRESDEPSYLNLKFSRWTITPYV